MERVMREVALVQASALARAGRYNDAELLLSETAGEGPASAGQLDLLARIHAQRGRLAEADACWAQAGELYGRHDAFDDGRRRIAAIYARAARRRPGRLVALTVIALGFGASAGGVIWTTQRDSAASASQLRALHQALSGLGAAVQEERAATRAQQESLAAEVEAAQAPLRSVEADMAIPGVLVRRGPEELTLTFDAGLFRSGTVLTPEGERLLTEIGQRLSAHREQVAVTVAGHTDDRLPIPGGRYLDNVDLGIARALTAARTLSASGGIPLGDIASLSAGAEGAPFPNDPSAGRPRNRTVTIRIAPRRP